MAQHTPLPAPLASTFSVADATALGVGRGRLRGNDLTTPFRGVRQRVFLESPDGLPMGSLTPFGTQVSLEADLRRRVAAFATVMPPHAFFVGSTAAFLRGAPLPSRVLDTLHVGVLRPHTPPRRSGIRGHQLRKAEVEVIDGFRVSDPTTTWASLADELDEYDMVAATDYFIRIPRYPGGFRPPDGEQLIAPQALRAAIKGRRNAEFLRRVLGRARTGASSRPETHLRLIVVDAGLPEPDIDFDVYDDSGSFIGASDLGYRSRFISLEFDGSHHREQTQFEYDIDRRYRFRQAGWDQVLFTARHVFQHRSEVVRRTRLALDSARARGLAG
ncbi:MAG: hypothetical protein QM607_10185 [Microbacterium sp.]